MTWPEDAGWRVRVGVSLVELAPMSAERRALIDRESKREAEQAEFEAQQRREAAIEHRWELERQGVVPHTIADVLAAASFEADRQDRRDARLEREAAEAMGRPPRSAALLREAKAEREAREAAEAATPASQSALGKVAQQVQNLASSVFGITGHRPML